MQTTEPSAKPVFRRSATASKVSVTGMSSSRVTTCTTVCRDLNTAVIESACRRIGPTFARSDTASATLRKGGMIRPVGGGASRTTAS